jgi:pimeloyl-ACP methyl ester carboxylesterase
METFVLIPGAGGVAWYWHRVAPLLGAEGHAVVTVDLPGADEGAGLPEYTTKVIDATAGLDHIVVVGQSLGAFTAAMVASSVPPAAVVFVNGMIPEPGETPGDWWDNTGAIEARRDTAVERGYSPEFDVETYFLHDVPAEVASAGAPLQREEADAAFATPCDFEAWPDVPIHSVAGEDDRFFPVDFQRRLARDRLDTEADVLPGGHLTAISQPQELASYLLEVGSGSD